MSHSFSIKYASFIGSNYWKCYFQPILNEILLTLINLLTFLCCQLFSPHTIWHTMPRYHFWFHVSPQGCSYFQELFLVGSYSMQVLGRMKIVIRRNPSRFSRTLNLTKSYLKWKRTQNLKLYNSNQYYFSKQRCALLLLFRTRQLDWGF